ncbi:MAG: iron-sulfur cluster assembly scaffold protein [Erythrobacter sp.]
MNAVRSAALYTPDMLALAASLAKYPLAKTFDLRVEERAQPCGSTIVLGIDCDPSGRLAHMGMQVTACAVGQSSAAILASGAQGLDKKTSADILRAIEAWLKGDASLPDWPGFAALETARDVPGRHGALLLAWRAAARALYSYSGPR